MTARVFDLHRCRVTRDFTYVEDIVEGIVRVRDGVRNFDWFTDYCP